MLALIADIGPNTATVFAAFIGAGGTVLTAYVAVIATRTNRTVNGRTTELMLRVANLEELLTFARAQDAETPDEAEHGRTGLEARHAADQARRSK